MVGVAAGIVVGCDGALWSAMGCCGSGGVSWCIVGWCEPERSVEGGGGV